MHLTSPVRQRGLLVKAQHPEFYRDQGYWLLHKEETSGFHRKVERAAGLGEEGGKLTEGKKPENHGNTHVCCIHELRCDPQCKHEAGGAKDPESDGGSWDADSQGYTQKQIHGKQRQ